MEARCLYQPWIFKKEKVSLMLAVAMVQSVSLAKAQGVAGLWSMSMSSAGLIKKMPAEMAEARSFLRMSRKE